MCVLATPSLTDAATPRVAVCTCILSLWDDEMLGLAFNSNMAASGVETENDAPSLPPSALMYGGSLATGTITIQMLKISELDVITICSPRNFKLVRAGGASTVWYYADPSTTTAIRTHTQGRLKYVLDCISDTESVTCCYATIGRAGGRYESLEFVPDELLRKRRAVRSSFVMAAEIYGDEVKPRYYLPSYTFSPYNLATSL